MLTGSNRFARFCKNAPGSGFRPILCDAPQTSTHDNRFFEAHAHHGLRVMSRRSTRFERLY
jgi:hypothetical protein